jgi:hypothetical protein
MQSLGCLGDADCSSKIECALSCTTESCINGCAGASPSAATSNLISCAVGAGCVDPGAAVAVKKADPAACAQANCFMQSLGCLGDADCSSKIECALSCTTESCINGCAGASPSAATSNLISCAVGAGCVEAGFQRDVVNVAKSMMASVQKAFVTFAQ